MTDFKWDEAQGQINMFDCLSAPTIGDLVIIKYDEHERLYAESYLPYLLIACEIIGQKLEFYYIQFGEYVEVVAQDKVERVQRSD